jgi:cell fate (sporulation/competence/biofilm development) regulator YlbF (YheA/YmcA/DUF963 family)
LKEEILRKAQELNLLLKNSSEYQGYVSAVKNAREHSAADIMLRDYRKKQQEIYEKAMKGEKIDQNLKELEELWGVISLNPYVRAVVENELIFKEFYSQIIRELSKGLELEEQSETKEDENSK